MDILNKATLAKFYISTIQALFQPKVTKTAQKNIWIIYRSFL